MIIWMVGVISLSIVLIFLIHQVYEYLKKSFSKPLERNIVNETKSHYEQIYNTLATTRQQVEKPVQMPTEIYAQQPTETMADELMNFMSNLDNDNDVVVATPPDLIEESIQPYEPETDIISAF
jgi:predicted lactoylglutathione lyase